jgi:hypothetical protein
MKFKFKFEFHQTNSMHQPFIQFGKTNNVFFLNYIPSKELNVWKIVVYFFYSHHEIREFQGVTAASQFCAKNAATYRRGARRIGLNRRGSRRLAVLPVGPAAVDLTVVAHGSRQLDLLPPWPMAVAVGHGGWWSNLYYKE